MGIGIQPFHAGKEFKIPVQALKGTNAGRSWRRERKWLFTVFVHESQDVKALGVE